MALQTDPPLLLVGTDFRCSPIEIRERVALHGEETEHALVHLLARPGIGHGQAGHHRHDADGTTGHCPAPGKPVLRWGHNGPNWNCTWFTICINFNRHEYEPDRNR